MDLPQHGPTAGLVDSLGQRLYHVLRIAASRKSARMFPRSFSNTGSMKRADDGGFPHVTNHHFRHARISEWANSTRRLAAVQFMARHLSIATTALYVRSRTEAAAEMLREIAEAERRGPGARQGKNSGTESSGTVDPVPENDAA